MGMYIGFRVYGYHPKKGECKRRIKWSLTCKLVRTEVHRDRCEWQPQKSILIYLRYPIPYVHKAPRTIHEIGEYLQLESGRLRVSCCGDYGLSISLHGLHKKSQKRLIHSTETLLKEFMFDLP